jgi:hypothetical protein
MNFTLTPASPTPFGPGGSARSVPQAIQGGAQALQYSLAPEDLQRLE